MKIRNLLTRPIIFCFLLLLTVSLTQFLYFAQMVERKSPPKYPRMDVTLVFDGDNGRIEEGFKAAAQNACPWLVFSSRQTTFIERYAKSIPNPYIGSVTVVTGAWTTDQDARFTLPAVKSLMDLPNLATHRAGGPKQGLLVTSWYHMPRAYILTRLYSLGSGIEWSYDSVGSIPADWWKRAEFWSELVKFWGSLERIGLSWIGIENWPRPKAHP